MAYEGKFSQQIEAVCRGPWGIVEVATEFEAAGPEVLARFRRQFNWCATSWLRLSGGGHDQGFQTLSGGSRLQRASLQEVRYFTRRKPSTGWDTAPRGGCKQGDPRQHGLNTRFIQPDEPLVPLVEAVGSPSRIHGR